MKIDLDRLHDVADSVQRIAKLKGHLDDGTRDIYLSEFTPSVTLELAARIRELEHIAQPVLMARGLFVCRGCGRTGNLKSDAGLMLDSGSPIVYCRTCSDGR